MSCDYALFCFECRHFVTSSHYYFPCSIGKLLILHSIICKDSKGLHITDDVGDQYAEMVSNQVKCGYEYSDLEEKMKWVEFEYDPDYAGEFSIRELAYDLINR